MTPCSLVNMYRWFGVTSYVHHQGRREHPYEEASSSAMSVYSYQTAWRLIPEDSNLHSHRRQKISSDLQNTLSRKFCIPSYKKKITEKIVGQAYNNQWWQIRPTFFHSFHRAQQSFKLLITHLRNPSVWNSITCKQSDRPDLKVSHWRHTCDTSSLIWTKYDTYDIGYSGHKNDAQ